MGDMCCSGSKLPGGETTRRGFMLGLVGVTGTVLIGCTVNPNTGEQQFIIVGEQELDRMSVESWQQIRSDVPELKDPATQQRLQDIGQRIVQVANLQERSWEFVVFDSEKINAFALPGGQVGIFTGILALMENDAQLATVVGHEVGHVAGRHSAARVSRGMAAEVGMQAAAQALAIGNVTGANAVLSLLGAGVTYGVVLPFSRGQELEADALGVQYMAKAGYDPVESIEFWQRMAQQGGERPPEFASTHPAPDTRIAQLEQLARKWRPVYRENA